MINPAEHAAGVNPHNVATPINAVGWIAFTYPLLTSSLTLFRLILFVHEHVNRLTLLAQSNPVPS